MSVRITLSENEALVLFDLLSRNPEADSIQISDQAEHHALWNLESMLESQLGSVISDAHALDLSRARAELRDTPQFTLVFLKGQTLLIKCINKDFKDLQQEYPDYKTSLDFSTTKELVEYLKIEYGKESAWPFTVQEIKSFAGGCTPALKTSAVLE